MLEAVANGQETLGIRWDEHPCLERGKPATEWVRRLKSANESMINRSVRTAASSILHRLHHDDLTGQFGLDRLPIADEVENAHERV